MLILKGVAFHLRVRGTSVPCDLFATLPLALLWNSPPPNPLACVCFGEDGGWGVGVALWQPNSSHAGCPRRPVAFARGFLSPGVLTAVRGAHAPTAAFRRPSVGS